MKLKLCILRHTLRLYIRFIIWCTRECLLITSVYPLCGIESEVGLYTPGYLCNQIMSSFSIIFHRLNVNEFVIIKYSSDSKHFVAQTLFVLTFHHMQLSIWKFKTKINMFEFYIIKSWKWHNLTDKLHVVMRFRYRIEKYKKYKKKTFFFRGEGGNFHDYFNDTKPDHANQ